MTSLIISNSVLALAPIIYFSATRFGKLWAVFEKFLMITVASMVVLHILPESIRAIGHQAVIFAFIGLFLPSTLERIWTLRAAKIHYISILCSLFGLFVHGLMDGAALGIPSMGALNSSGDLLKLAVILHRLPAALFIWSLFYPKHGATIPSLALMGLATSTAIGYFSAEWMMNFAKEGVKILFSFQALVAGSLLHIAFDRHDNEHDHSH